MCIPTRIDQILDLLRESAHFPLSTVQNAVTELEVYAVRCLGWPGIDTGTFVPYYSRTVKFSIGRLFGLGKSPANRSPFEVKKGPFSGRHPEVSRQAHG